MSPFARNHSNKWHDEVPGSRWFKADLHIHTLDDHASSNFKRPDGINGLAADPGIQEAYARAFLKSSIERKIEILGLTPHAVRSGETDDTSATWKIIEVWNDENDNDGIPFRDKIYAIFPGFEVNLTEGSSGLHLIFLFDPEIGRERYLSAFNEAMGSVSPWANGSLQISTKNAETVFKDLNKWYERIEEDWKYLCLAPHAFSEKGLFSSIKSQVLRWFQHQNITGIELKDNWLPEDALNDKDWLKDGLDKHHQSLYHSSDAYNVSDIGRRYTLIKMASPRIESLRQVFLASDSRMIIPFEKDENSNLVEKQNLPEPIPSNRPWLKRLVIKGGTSFFGGINSGNNTPRQQTFKLNPDFNCIIGGRMTGKSTLLDGLRVWLKQKLPKDDALKKDVEARASEVFLSGNPEIVLSIHGPINPTAPYNERWPAIFYTQREIQTSIKDHKVQELLLYRIIPSETKGLLNRKESIQEIDNELKGGMKQIIEIRSRLEEAVQELIRINQAEQALVIFRDAGIDNLLNAQSDLGNMQNLSELLINLQSSISDLIPEANKLSSISFHNPNLGQYIDGTNDQKGINQLSRRFQVTLRYARLLIRRMLILVQNATATSNDDVATVMADVQRALTESGKSAEELNHFSALSDVVSQKERWLTRYNHFRSEYYTSLRNFVQSHRKRKQIIIEQRKVMAKVSEIISKRFPDRIRLRTRENGLYENLENWILSMREVGITRWWNNQKDKIIITPETIREKIRSKRLQDLGMTPQVCRTFLECMNFQRKLELATIRNEDRYIIERKVGSVGDEYRPLEKLSGGSQVSVMLSLLLESEDSDPLIIDQPEDEIDKTSLFEIILPALRSLKGKRQVIFSTHDANIVVNGDADHVIVLDADANAGWVKNQGTIDEEKIRNSIIMLLDGGPDAFSLRKAKYGF